MAAAVASAGGNDATTAGIAAAGSEAAAPVLAKWLYDKDSSDDLTAAEKQTLTAIMGAASTTVGATTGNVNNAIAAGQAGQNAVENNYLSYQEKSKQLELKDNLQECVASGNCSEEEKGNLQQQIDQLNDLDQKRETDYATACSGSANNDCNNEMGKAGLAYRSYDEPAKQDGGFIANKELAAEQDHTRNLMFNVSSNIDTEYVAPALDNVDIMAGAFSLGTVLSGTKVLSKASGIVDDAAAATSKVNTATAQATNNSLGHIDGTFDAITPGSLSDNVAGTFSGGRYQSITLQNDTVLYRGGTVDQPLGQYFSLDAPTSVIQTRIDKAVLPVWPGGAKSPIDTAFEVKIPAGTQVHVGEVGSQGGAFIGGTEQIIVLKPWTIDGVEILGSSPLK